MNTILNILSHLFKYKVISFLDVFICGIHGIKDIDLRHGSRMGSDWI